MKKSLFFAFIASGLVAFGQGNATVQEYSGLNIRAKVKLMSNEGTGTPQAPYLPGSRSALIEDLGQAANVFTVAFGRRDAVSVRPELNAISFVHRSNYLTNGDANNGSLRYDLSTDGGSTFTNNIGPVYNGGDARYPSAQILNMETNTEPNNAKLFYTGPTLTETNGDAWGGQLLGSVTLGMGQNDTMNIIEQSDAAAEDYYLISAGLWASGMVAHHTDIEVDLITLEDYTDTIIYRRADYSSGSLAYTREELYVPVYGDTSGKAIVDAYIGFGPDGQTGYIAAIGHGNDLNVAPVGAHHLIVLKTTDGGISWGPPTNVELSTLADPYLLNDGSDYTTGFEGDIAVDINGDMHFSVAIGPVVVGTPWSIGTAPGFWGIFDVHGDGTNFNADLIATPQTFRGMWTSLDGSSTVSEDSRPQVSVSANGDFITVTWFDTDTILYGPDNLNPDAYVRGYDVLSQTWFPEENVSLNTFADAQCTWGTVGDLMFKNGNDITVAIVYASLAFSDVLNETQFHYLDGDYLIGIEENNIAEMRIFPNPATDRVYITFDIKAADHVTVNLVNLVGQTVMTTSQSAVTGGNVVTIDVSDLASGLYFAEVRSGKGSSTQRLVVQ